AKYCDNHQRAMRVIPLIKRQIAQQFAPDGSMPREIGRPNSLFYSIYGLRAFVVLAKLAEDYSESLWHFRIGPQRSPAIANSINFLLPYLSEKQVCNDSKLDPSIIHYALQVLR